MRVENLPIEEYIERSRAGKMLWMLVFGTPLDVLERKNLEEAILASGGGVRTAFGEERTVLAFIELPCNLRPKDVDDIRALTREEYPEGTECASRDPLISGAIGLWNHMMDELWAIRSADPAVLAKELKRRTAAFRRAKKQQERLREKEKRNPTPRDDRYTF